MEGLVVNPDLLGRRCRPVIEGRRSPEFFYKVQAVFISRGTGGLLVAVIGDLGHANVLPFESLEFEPPALRD